MEHNLLIAYYSHSGNTEKIAELICGETGGMLFKIEPAAPYPASYDAVVAQAKKEISAGFRPALLEKGANTADYDTIFIGTPNWWSTMAPPVASFLSENDLSGKTVVPFCTPGGGGLAGIARDIEALCPRSIVKKAFSVYGNGSARAETEVAAWLGECMC